MPLGWPEFKSRAVNQMPGRIFSPENVRCAPQVFLVHILYQEHLQPPFLCQAPGSGTQRGARQTQARDKLRLVRELIRGQSKSLNWRFSRDPGSLAHSSVPAPKTLTHTQNRKLGICQSDLIAEGSVQWPLQEGR